VKTIDEEIGDGADRRRKRIRLVERYIKRAGTDGLSDSEIEAMSAYMLGLTGKKTKDIIKLLRKLRKIKRNEKDRWITI